MANQVQALPTPPSQHPFKASLEAPGRWYRVHVFDSATGLYGPTQFNDTQRGDARFSPLVDPATGSVIPTIYAAISAKAAIAEIVLHDVPIPSTGHLHDWESTASSLLHVSQLDLPSLILCNLTSTGMRAAGLRVQDLFGTEKPDYPRTREWALHIWQTLPQVQGLLWMSVRENTSKVLMLFGDRIDQASCVHVGQSSPIKNHEQEVMELLDLLGCGLA